MNSTKHLLILSAPTQETLDEATDSLCLYLQQAQPDLADVAYSLLQQPSQAFRRCVVVQDMADAITVLHERPVSRVFNHHQPPVSRQMFFLFPGIGDHYLQMGRALYETAPVFQEVVDNCSATLLPYLGATIPDLLYPAQDEPMAAAAPQIDLRAMLGRGTQAAPSPTAARLQETAVAHPVVFTIEYALAQLLISWGIRPAAMMGYSLGEYVCACLAGVLSLQDALTLVAQRAQLIQALPAGRMLAVSAEKTAVQPYLSAQIALAAHNSIANCVLAGEPEAIAQVQADLEAQDIVCRRLDTTHAFHSHMLQDLGDEMTQLARECNHHSPQIPYISNVTGTWITANEATDPAYWTYHMTQTVRCYEGLQTGLTSVHQHLFLEVGPGQSLGSFAKQHPACTRDQVGLILSSLPSAYDSKQADTFLLEMAGKLWLLDHAPNWAQLHLKSQQMLTLPPPFHGAKSNPLPSASQRNERGVRRRQRRQNRSH